MASIIIETEPTVYPNTNNFTAPDIEISKCNICQEDTSNNSVKTPCNHEFCGDCFFKWMQEKPNCPLCRKEFVNENIMTDINANREELSVISSEITYLKVKYSKMKKQARKMYAKSEMSWERQIRLRRMLEDTRQSIIKERRILKKIRIKRINSKKINNLYKEEDEKITGLLDYIDGYCHEDLNDSNNYLSSIEVETKDETKDETDETKDETNEANETKDETKDETDETLDETLWNNILLDDITLNQTENPEEVIYDTDTTEDLSSSDEEDFEFTYSSEWPPLNEPFLISNAETVIFTFGEN